MNILNALPGIVPTVRSYTMAKWPQKRMSMRNKRIVRWPLVNKPSGDFMEITWLNVTYAQAEELCLAWDKNYGKYGLLSLPATPLNPAVLAGTSEDLKQFMSLPFAGATWHFTDIPRVESVKGGRCTVKMRIGIRGSATYPTDNQVPQPEPAYPQPIIELNPTFFWDPSIDSTVTLSGSEIQSIADQGSRGWTLTKSTTGPQIYTDGNGRKWINWGTAGHSNYLRNTTTTDTSIAEWYIVVDANFGSTFPSYNGLITATVDDSNPNEWFVTGAPGQSGFDPIGSNYNVVFINGSTTNGINAVLPTINSPALLRIKRSDDAAVTLQSGVQLGNDRNNANRGWGGLVGAVVGFSAPPSSTNRAICEDKLMARFGIST